eukprot:2776530-Prymnesium_polylepis.1
MAAGARAPERSEAQLATLRVARVRAQRRLHRKGRLRVDGRWRVDRRAELLHQLPSRSVQRLLREPHLHAPPVRARSACSERAVRGTAQACCTRRGERRAGHAARLQPHMSRWRVFMRRSSCGRSSRKERSPMVASG